MCKLKAWPSNNLSVIQVVAVALLGWHGVEGQGQRCETQADCTGKARLLYKIREYESMI